MINPFSFGGVSLVSSVSKMYDILPAGEAGAAMVRLVGLKKLANVEEASHADVRWRAAT